MEGLISGKGITKVYKTGDVEVFALRGLDFSISEGEFNVILGPSGSGKSTLLNIIGGLDTPSEGELFYRGNSLINMDNRQLTNYRRSTIGFVFQFYNLMPNLTAKENIKLASDVADAPLDIGQLLHEIDLEDRAGYFPSQLSGGQQQRIAIARAVIKNPDLLLCDEPTGALDLSTGIQVLRVLQKFNREYKKTVAIITHNSGIAAMANKVFILKDGQIAQEYRNESPVDAEEVKW